MNTILITGTAKQTSNLSDPNVISFGVNYDVNIWGSRAGEPLQLITSKKEHLTNYGELWKMASGIAVKYFESEKMNDGAYTQFLDHLIIL